MPRLRRALGRPPTHAWLRAARGAVGLLGAVVIVGAGIGSDDASARPGTASLAGAVGPSAAEPGAPASGVRERADLSNVRPAAPSSAPAESASASTEGPSTTDGGEGPFDPRVVERDGGPARVDVVAAALRRDRLFVSPSLTRVATPAAVAALRRRLEAMPVTTYVAVVARVDDGLRTSSSSDFLTILSDRVGRSGLYVVMDGNGYGLQAQAVEVRPKGEVGRAGIAALNGVPRDEGPLARVEAALQYLATGVEPPRSVSDERDDQERLPWLAFGGAAALAFLLPVGLVLAGPAARERRRLRRAARREAADVSSRVTAPAAGEARGDALDAVAGLARAIAEDPAPADRAVRAYDAASHVLGMRSATVVDLVGAATLARAGRAWLNDPQWRPCFFDPRHGQATARTRWRRGLEDVSIPTCRACAGDVRARRTPAMLADDGRPYFERDSVWARTGFGAVDDDVAEIVLAGDGRRR